jgi:uncharacterized membrane protein YtjA (UPF0391 family)
LLYWALIFFVLAIVAGLLGFQGFARSADMAGRILFFVFVGLSLVSLLTRFIRRRKQ